MDIRGRSGTLRINYRTSHQIRAQADRLLGKRVSDVDGNTEERGGTISVFNGPTPTLHVLDSPQEEAAVVGRWLADGEMSVFVRSPLELPRARGAVTDEGDLEEVYDTERAGRPGLSGPRADREAPGRLRSGAPSGTGPVKG